VSRARYVGDPRLPVAIAEGEEHQQLPLSRRGLAPRGEDETGLERIDGTEAFGQQLTGKALRVGLRIAPQRPGAGEGELTRRGLGEERRRPVPIRRRCDARM
jgi:hypothetical protein